MGFTINAKLKVNLLKEVPTEKIYVGKKHKYLAVNIYVNDEPDQYGNTVSITVPNTKEERDAGKKPIYLGEGKKYVEKVSSGEDDGFPF